MASFLLFAVLAKAVPADPKPFIFKQPDQTDLTVYLKGDERISWAETQDGYTILYSDSQKGYVYATQNTEKKLITSSFLAHNPENRSSIEQSFLSVITPKLQYSAEQKETIKNTWKSTNQATEATAFPGIGKRKLLCILIGFPDKPFTKTHDDFDSLMNQPGYSVAGATGSVHDYYEASSFGKFDLHVDVVGPYTAKKSIQYYGQDQGDWKDIYVKELISEAVTYANADVNYQDYDNDKDGYVDGICIIYAGYAQAQGGPAYTIWPHQGNLPQLRFDGVNLNNYFCASELVGNFGSILTPIGTICHEFGHTLGLLDYYDTDYEGSGGTSDHPGSWNVMSQGSYNNGGKTPPYWDMYSRSTQKWCTWTRLNSSQEVTMKSCGEDTIGYYFESAVLNEYFFLENRQQTDKWGYGLPGHGMLIYHVDKNNVGWTNNKVNIDPTKRSFYIESAVPRSQPSVATAGDPFPGTSGKTSFTDNTTPNALSISGKPSNSPITNISETNGVIKFYFKGEPTVTTDMVSDISSDSAICSGKFLNYGTGGILDKGICWALYPTVPRVGASSTTSNNHLLPNADTSAITCALFGLMPETTYNVCTYASTAYGTQYGYGATLKFSTNKAGTPIVNTIEIINIDTAKATGNAIITKHGNSTPTNAGFCWSKTNSLPTISDSNVTNVYVNDSFTGSLTNLSPSTLYYVRAFAKNNEGTSYGNIITFYTNGLPITSNIIIAKDTMICAGKVPDTIKGSKPTGGSGTFTYQWLQSNDQVEWNIAPNTASNMYYIPTAIVSPTYFRRVAVSGALTDTSNISLINVTTPSMGGVVAVEKSPDSTVVGIAVIKLVNYHGDIKNWQRSTDKVIFSNVSTSPLDIFVDTLKSVGTYTYRVRVQNGICPGTISDTVSVVVRTPYTGIELVENTDIFEVYPNPTNGIITLAFSQNIMKKADVTVVNATGEVVYQKNGISCLQNQSQKMDLSKLPQGIYFIKILSDNANYVRKINIVK